MADISSGGTAITDITQIITRNHNDLQNRDAADAHPESAVTGLSTDLAGKVDKSGSITQVTTRNHNDLQNRDAADAHSNITQITTRNHNDMQNRSAAGTHPLSSLSDVTIIAPITNQILEFNGMNWINGAQLTVGAGPGIIFYLDSTDIIGPGPGPQTIAIETLSKTPTGGVEVTESVTVNNSTGMIDQYLYNTALGISSISAGEWTFDTYCYVDNAAGVSEVLISVGRVFIGPGTITITDAGVSRTATVTGGTPFIASDFNADISLTSYIITPTAVLRIIGFTSTSVVTVETLVTYSNDAGIAYSVDRFLFQDTTGEINNLTVALFTHTVVEPAFACNTTDKLTTRYYGRTDNVGNIIITFVHNGTQHYTRIHTPLPTSHNDLAGLQGGGANERYHSTLAEYTKIQVLGTISTKTTAYIITSSDYTILADATAASFAATLPTAVGISGTIYNIKKIDSSVNTVTVDTTGGQTIDGTLTQVISAQYDSITVQSNNANWFII